MKTTLNLDDRLLREAKKRAVEEGTTLTRVVEEALRGALAPRPVAQAYVFDPEVVRGERSLAVDVADRDALYDFMTDE